MRKYIIYIGLLILPALLIYGSWRKMQLKKYPRYTITTTIRQIRTLKNGLQIEHFYYVNGEKYVERYSKDERLNIAYPNGKYIVRFSSNHPSISEVLWNFPVIYSIKDIPVTGWEENPLTQQ